MNDLISRQAAIDALTEYGNGRTVYIGVEEAIRRIEQLPPAQPVDKDINVSCKDAISRQGAIDICNIVIDLWQGQLGEGALVAIKNAINNLPSVQPDIIHCKDCKHSEHWYRDKSRCFLWHEEGIDVFEDGFCSYAERRTDGSD